MNKMKSMLLMALTALAALVVVSSAMATSISPANTAYTAFSSNSVLSVAGTTVSCTSSTVTGTTPSTTGVTTVSAPISLRYSGCTAFGIANASVTVATTSNANTICSGSTSLVLNGMYNGTTGPATVTIPSGCTVYINAGCSTASKVNGPQTIGTSQADAFYTNGTSSVATKLTFKSAPVSVTAGTFPCSGGTGTLSGDYSVTSPAAPGFVVNP